MQSSRITRWHIAAHHIAVAHFYEKGCNNNLKGDQSASVMRLMWDWSESVAACWQSSCRQTSDGLIARSFRGRRVICYCYRKREKQTSLRVNAIMLRTCIKVIAIGGPTNCKAQCAHIITLFIQHLNRTICFKCSPGDKISSLVAWDNKVGQATSEIYFKFYIEKASSHHLLLGLFEGLLATIRPSPIQFFTLSSQS